MLAEEAFNELYPENDAPTFELKYSGKFKGYNANITHHKLNNHIVFKLSRNWKDVSDEIKKGLLQSLLVKVYKSDKRNKTTHAIDFYNNFLRAVPKYSIADEIDPELEDSFSRVNDQYFNGLMNKPNLVWGAKSNRQLGCFDYGSNTIKISSALNEADSWLLDYVMYHEMLHKKHLFVQKNGRSFHHTTDFKNDEKKYNNFHIVDKALKDFLKKKIKKRFLLFDF